MHSEQAEFDFIFNNVFDEFPTKEKCITTKVEREKNKGLY